MNLTTLIMNLTTLKKSAGALAVAVVLGATAMSAAPAQAQSFSFGIDGGNDRPSFSFGFGNDRDRWRPRPPAYRPACVSPRSIERSLENNGYRRVRVDIDRRGVEAYGIRDGYLYRFEFTCSGRLVDRDRLRRV